MLWRVPRVLRPGIPQADDELHETSGQPNRARSRPGGPVEMVAAAVRRGRFGRLRPASRAASGREQPPLQRPHRGLLDRRRHGPSRRRGAHRGSRGGAARRPLTSARRRSGRRGPPLPGRWPARPRRRCRPGVAGDPGAARTAMAGERSRRRGALPLVRREGFGRQQRERQDVGRAAVPRCSTLSAASSVSSARTSPIDAGDGAPAAASAAAMARARRPPLIGARRPRPARSRSIRHGPT